MSVASYSSSHRTKNDGSISLSNCKRHNKRLHATSLSSSPSPPNYQLPMPHKQVLFLLIDIAIELDEAMDDESILRVPLESGSFYNPRLFDAALSILRKNVSNKGLLHAISTPVTAPSAASTNKKSPSKSSRDEGTKVTTTTTSQRSQQNLKMTPLTPIILSGFLSNYTGGINNRNRDQIQAIDDTEVSSTELVQYTHQRRRAAISRLKRRKGRQRMHRIATPILVFGIALGFYFYTMRNLRMFFTEYGFVDSCETTHIFDKELDGDIARRDSIGSASSYHGACREAEAFTWEKLNQAQPFLYVLEDCTIEDCALARSLEEKIPLYTMHTQLQGKLIPLEDILGRKRRRKRTVKTQHSNVNDYDLDFGSSAIRWLGDSLINRLVRNAISTAIKQEAVGKAERFSLLDAGSGLSGLLFSLLDFPFGEWSYLGITISQPEAARANKLLEMHKISSEFSPSLKNVTVRQANFDDVLPPKSFHIIVAVESLGYSQNISRTIANLVGALKPKGSLIIVEDVLAPWAKNSPDIERLVNLSAKKSMLTHDDWTKTFASSGLVFNLPPRDLTLEFDSMLSSYSERTFPLIRESVRRLSQWYGRKEIGSTSVGIGARAIHLLSDLIQRATGHNYRQTLYRQAELTLMMYTCIKH
ncbi:methyltransferase domain containing protein [Nitzschia inconspicua]|uniref:Methyltransferase domain containing protein n=1 Tax=Nitzschia inconspicua TaxID=303405 RepID=A0A9K3Q7B5_9STRA|nr:methyltransferase domain containing protein [Nitzschia inconspicua]